MIEMVKVKEEVKDLVEVEVVDMAHLDRMIEIEIEVFN